MSTRDASPQPTAAVVTRTTAGPVGQAAPPSPTVQPARRFLPALPSTERQRVRWFVAGHVLAVWLVFQLAMLFGEDHAPPPFPPDLSPAQRAQALALPSRPADTDKQQPGTSAPPAIAPAELARPLEWSR